MIAGPRIKIYDSLSLYPIAELIPPIISVILFTYFKFNLLLFKRNKKLISKI